MSECYIIPVINCCVEKRVSTWILGIASYFLNASKRRTCFGHASGTEWKRPRKGELMQLQFCRSDSQSQANSLCMHLMKSSSRSYGGPSIISIPTRYKSCLCISPCFSLTSISLFYQKDHQILTCTGIASMLAYQ